MPDTPRTRAELLAIFADNNTGAISAQDVRDLIVSITDPVAGGGFDRLGLPSSQRAAGINDHPLGAFTIADGSASTISFAGYSDISDPNGWIQSSTYPDTGGAFGEVWYALPVFPVPAFSWVRLTPGLYDAYGAIRWTDSAVPANGAVSVWMESLADPLELDPILGGEQYQYPYVQGLFPAFTPPTSTSLSIVDYAYFHQKIRVPEENIAGDPVTDWGFFMIAQVSGIGAPLGIQYAEWSIWQIA